jgi:hypothetical protein
MRIGGYQSVGSTRGAGLPPRPLLRELPCQMCPRSEDSSIDVSESTSLVEFRCASSSLKSGFAPCEHLSRAPSSDSVGRLEHQQRLLCSVELASVTSTQAHKRHCLRTQVCPPRTRIRRDLVPNFSGGLGRGFRGALFPSFHFRRVLLPSMGLWPRSS